MKKALFILLVIPISRVMAQETNTQQIEKLAKDIAAFFSPAEHKLKVGLSEFTYNGQITQFSRLVCEEFASELLMANGAGIIVVNEAKWNSIDSIASKENFIEKIILIGKENMADYVCSGRIFDSESGYKIHVQVHETKEGNLITASKVTIIKTSLIENLNTQILSQTIADSNQVITENVEPEKKQKEKRKGEGKFWQTLGDIATNGLEQVVNSTIEQKISKTPSNSSSNHSNGNSPRNNSGLGNGSGNNNGSSGNNNNNNGADCRSYINFVNSTEFTIQLTVYKGNPRNGYEGSRVLFSFTIAPGKSKKQEVSTDRLFYYSATTNVNGRFAQEIKDWEGTFQVEECDIIDEEIE